MIRYELERYALRDIEEDDLPQLLEWRNSPRIHSKMLTDHKITWDEHVAWFNRIKDDPIKKHFVFTYDGTPVGYSSCHGLDLEHRTSYGGAYIGAPDKCPKGAGIFLFYMGIDNVFSNYDIMLSELKVFADNKRVLRLNKVFGYEFDPSKDQYIEKDGERKLVVYGTLTKDRWLALRDQLVDQFQLGAARTGGGL